MSTFAALLGILISGLLLAGVLALVATAIWRHDRMPGFQDTRVAFDDFDTTRTKYDTAPGDPR